ncbi:MAG TPA: hypothetical protein PLI98_09580 [Candidatus Hydrogenedentes bacterium]|nr:hypothetical protein [Candidatus Hydrogenedentota bacterium]
MQAVTPEVADILRQQMLRVYLASRCPRVSREINLFKTRRVEAVRFPDRGIVKKFATIAYHFRELPDQKYKMVFTLSRGDLFFLNYSAFPPKRAMRRYAPVIDKVTIHFDPMVPYVEPEPVEPDYSLEPFRPLTGWMAEWRETYGMSSFALPQSKKYCREKFKELGITPPEDYLDLLSQTDGVSLGAAPAGVAELMGVDELFPLALTAGDFVMIGDVHPASGGVVHLLLRAGARDRKVYRTGDDDAEPRALGTSFREAVEAVLGSPPESTSKESGGGGDDA